jgi:hypothetical protein
LIHPRRRLWTAAATSVWGAGDADGGYHAQNLLGVTLMRVRDELTADVRTGLRTLAPVR